MCLGGFQKCLPQHGSEGPEEKNLHGPEGDDTFNLVSVLNSADDSGEGELFFSVLDGVQKGPPHGGGDTIGYPVFNKVGLWLGHRANVLSYTE